MRNADLRRKLFDRGAEALRLFTGHDEKSLYACPLCGRGFSQASLATQPPDLTLEHVPPRAVAGHSARAVALVCRGCNSTAGHELDAQAARREGLFRFAYRESGRFEGNSKVAGISLNATVHMLEDFVHVDLVPKANDPAALAAVEAEFQRIAAAAEKPELRIGFPTYHSRAAELSDLRSAFLATFACLGYRYAFSPGALPVRRQILDPNVVSLASFALLEPEAPRGRYLVCIGRDDDGTWFPVVLLGVHGVLLPGISHDAQSFYNRMRERGNADRLKMDVKVIGWPKGLDLALDFHRAAPNADAVK